MANVEKPKIIYLKFNPNSNLYSPNSLLDYKILFDLDWKGTFYFSPPKGIQFGISSVLDLETFLSLKYHKKTFIIRLEGYLLSHVILPSQAQEFSERPLNLSELNP